MGSSGRLITSMDIADLSIVNADVSGSAGIALSKLQAIGASLVVREISSGIIGGGYVINANVDPSAGIAASKLAAGGTANRVMATADGSNMAMQQIVAAMIAPDTITATQLAADSVGFSELADNAVWAANIQDGQVTNAKLFGGITTDKIAGGAISAGYRNGISATVPSTSGQVDVSGSGLNVVTAAGDIYWYGFEGTVSTSVAGAIIGVLYYIGGSQMISVGVHASPSGANVVQAVSMFDVQVAGAGTYQHKLQFSTNAGVLTLNGLMSVLVIKR